ncbi:MAG: hypothetical protein ACPGZU_14060, partial [Ketobacter sp.]
MHRHLIAFLLILMTTLQVSASPLLLSDDGNGINLNNSVQYIEDAQHQVSIADIMEGNPQWIENDSKTFNKSYN